MAAKKKTTRARAERSPGKKSSKRPKQARARKQPAKKAAPKSRPAASAAPELDALLATWLTDRSAELGSALHRLLDERLAQQAAGHAAQLSALQADQDERIRTLEREHAAELREAELAARRELAAVERRSKDAIERAERDAKGGVREARAELRELRRQLRSAAAQAERSEARLQQEHARVLQQVREEAADTIARQRLDHEKSIKSSEARLQELERSREALREAVGDVDYSARSSRRSRRLSH